MIPKGSIQAAFAAAWLACLSAPPAHADDPHAATPGGAGSAAPTVAEPQAAAPTAADPQAAAFADRVRGALTQHDLDFFENQLVNWDGVRARQRRLTLFQIRECFSRPIKDVSVEPLKSEADTPLVPAGFKTNMPVTHLLRVTFDEPGSGKEDQPACVFMLSRVQASYRIALILSTAPHP